jgi:hypothetical protein
MNRSADVETAEISVRGKFVPVPAVRVGDLTVAITGRLLKTGRIDGEAWLDPGALAEPERIIETLRRKNAPIDIFRFSQRLPQTEPKYDYPHGWEDIAAIPLTTYDDWWENRTSQVTRKNVRRSEKRGVVVRPVEFDDRLIETIVAINNDAPVRGGRRYYHFGKSFDEVKKDYASFLDRSGFLGAFYGDEIIGIMRLIYQGEVTSVLQMLSKQSHYDKRPSNALVAKAVEHCVARGNTFLVYGQFIYDDDEGLPLTEFKRRNGFEQYFVPDYCVPFTAKGRWAIALHVHAGVRRLIPKRVKRILRRARAGFNRRRRDRAPNEESD